MLHARADQTASITLYIYPSPYGIRWDSPRALVASTLQNQVSYARSRQSGDKHSIGHVNIELRCPLEDGSIETIWAGVSSADSSEERELLLEQGYGLGVLFHTFRGKLLQGPDFVPALQKRFERGNIAFLTFAVSEAACARMRRYFQEYVSRLDFKKYGLPNRPRHGEGAGCTAFATSFLEIGGLFPSELSRAWSRLIRVPSRWIGGPSSGQSVSLLRLLFAPNTGRWAQAHEPHQTVFFWDPDLMFDWVQKTYDAASSPKANILPFQFEQRSYQKARGLWVDARTWPVPYESIWKL